jgi:hypothetical protein
VKTSLRAGFGYVYQFYGDFLSDRKASSTLIVSNASRLAWWAALSIGEWDALRLYTASDSWIAKISALIAFIRS